MPDPRPTTPYVPQPSTTDDVSENLRKTVPEAAPPNKAPADLPRVEGYEILSVLGRGGMGIVYQARQTALKRTVALKMILAGPHAGETELQRFRTEAEAVARLQHPNIVQVHEVGQRDGLPWFSLEFVAGGSLAERLRGAPQPPTAAAELIETLARAVHFAHQRGVIHRDLKPANILLTGTGAATGEASTRGQAGSATSQSGGARPAAVPAGPGAPKITDFGLAKQLDEDTGQTQSGAIMGTPSYMAPEQAEGRTHDIGPAADTYALGAILYECLTGRPPFRGATLLDTLEQVRTREPVPPRQLQPKLARDLETICLKCLHKDRQRRYASAEALADDLRCFLDGRPIQARPVGALERGVKLMRRYPVVSGLVAAVVLITIVSFILIASSSVFAYWKWQVADGETEKATSALREKDNALKEASDAVIETGKALRKESAALVEKDDALKKESAALVEKDDALKKESKARFTSDNNLSLSNIKLAFAAFTKFDLAMEDEYLDKCPPNHRSWEWNFLRRMRRADLLPFSGDGRPAHWAVIGPDGRRMAVANQDGSIVLWDLATCRPTLACEGHKNNAMRVVFRPDGARLASLGGSQNALEVVVWDCATGKRLLTLPTPDGKPGLAYSPDGGTLAFLEMEVRQSTPDKEGKTVPITQRVIQLRDGETGKETIHLEAIRPELAPKEYDKPINVTALAYSPDGNLLAGVCDDGRLTIWALSTGKIMTTFVGPGVPLWCVAWRPDGQVVVTGGDDDRVRFWRLDRQNLPAEHLLRTEQRGARALAFSPDGKVLTVAGADRTIRTWEGSDPANHSFSLVGAHVLVTLRGHSGELSCVSFSPNGRALVSVSVDGTLKLWDPRGGSVTRYVGEHTRRVLAMVFRPDGRLLVSSDDEGFIRFWDPEVGQELYYMRHSSFRVAVRALAFSPDGKVLASGGDDGNVRLWDLKTLKPILMLPNVKNRVTGLGFRPDDGKRLAVGTAGSLHLFDSTTGKLEQTLDKVLVGGGLAWASDGRRLAVSSYNSVRVLNLDTGEETFKAEGLFPAVANISFHKDGRRLAAMLPVSFEDRRPHFEPGSFDGAGAVRVWDVVEKRELFTLRTFAQRAVFSGDGQRLIAVGKDETRVWDASTGYEALALPGAGDAVDALAFSPYLEGVGQRMAVATSNAYLKDNQYSRIPGTIRVWEGPERHGLLSLRGHLDSVTALSAGGKFLVSTAKDSVNVWDVASGEPVRTLKPLADRLRIGSAGAIDRAGRLVAIPSAGFKQTHTGGVQLYDLSEKGNPALLPDYFGNIVATAFSPDGTLLATVRLDESDAGSGSKPDPKMNLKGDVKIWDVATRREVLTYTGHAEKPRSTVFQAQFSPDGERIASWGGSGTETGTEVRVWDSRTGKDFYILGGCSYPAYSADGKFLAVLSQERKGQCLRLVDVAGGEKRQELVLPNRIVTNLTFSPDSRCLAAIVDGVVVVWDLATSQRLFDIREPRPVDPDGAGGMPAPILLPATALLFLPDGRLAVGHSNGTVKVWDLPLASGPGGAVEVRSSTGLASYLHSLAQPKLRRAVALSEAGRHELAETEFLAVVELLTPLVRDHADVERYPISLAYTQRQLERLYRTTKRPDKAEAAAAAAAATARVAPDESIREPLDVEVGGYCYDEANKARQEGKLELASDLYAAAARLIEPALAKTPDNGELQTIVVNSHLLRSAALRDLKHYPEALAAVDSAAKFDKGATAQQIRLARALIFARMGDHAKGAAEAEAVVAAAGGRLPAPGLYGAGRIIAVAAQAARDDTKLPEPDRERLFKLYSSRAVGLLRAAHAAKFFAGAAERERLLEKEHDLDALRELPDFMKLADEVRHSP